VPGGGFLYTNTDTLAIGLVLQLPALAAQQARPEELLGRLKAHPSIAPLVEGAELKEYSAHLIPEGGHRMMPELVTDGLLVAGDAAAMCLAAGIWLEGVNFAIGAGIAAGQAAAEAVRFGDTSAAGLDGYQRRLEHGFVLADHRKLAGVPDLVMGDTAQRRLPRVAANVVERLFTVTDPQPKPGLVEIVRSELARSGLGLRDLVRDGWASFRGFG
jgi:electron transfer flavoprotein-quinone oxidoreductase